MLILKSLLFINAGFKVGVKPRRYSGKSEEENIFDIVSLTNDGEELAELPVSVFFYKRDWNTVKEIDPDDGRFYWVSKPSDTLIESTTVATDEIGRASVAFIPETGGVYRAVVQASDDQGRLYKSASSLWVSGWGNIIVDEKIMTEFL